MANNRPQSVICRYDGHDEYGNALRKSTKSECQEWCERGVTCNRPFDALRDELGLYELEERQHLNFFLLERWNQWLRSPYCQCNYASGNGPATGWCTYCKRPIDGDSANDINNGSNTDVVEVERIKRMRAGPTWVIVYENTVRAAEIALKLLIKVTAPEPEHEIRHNLRALWQKVPECAKDRVQMELIWNHHLDHKPHVVTATGEPVLEQLPTLEQPVFDQFGEEFNTVRYAWEQLNEKGIEAINQRAQTWPHPIRLYYLHVATEALLAVLQRHPWDDESRQNRWDRRVQFNIGLEEATYHTDWPPRYIIDKRITMEQE